MRRRLTASVLTPKTWHTQKPKLIFISHDVEMLLMIQMYPLYSPSLLGKTLLVGLWIPHDNRRSIYALPTEGQVFFFFFLSVCVDLKAALWGFTPSSLVSHFSGCHISSWNVHRLTSAVRNTAVRLWPTSSCPFCPVCSRFENWSGYGGREEMECFSCQTMLQKWSQKLSSLSICFLFFFKWLDVSVYLLQTSFYYNTGAGQPVDVLNSHVYSDIFWTLLFRGSRRKTV